MSFNFSLPPSTIPAGVWPTNLELAVGESAVLFGKTIELVSFQTIDTQNIYRAVVDVDGVTKNIIVGPGAIAIAINGVRLLGYAWAGMVPAGQILEQVSFQGGTPISAGKQVAFMVTDAAVGAYPRGQWFQTDEPNVNTFFQTFGEQNGPTDIHSGFDVGSNRFGGFKSPVAGELEQKGTNFTNGFGEPDGQFTIDPDDATIPRFVFTHINMNTVPAAGTHWNEGQTTGIQSAGQNPTPHIHWGTEGHDAGNNVNYGAHLWNFSTTGYFRNTPRSWLVLGEFAGTIANSSLGFSESGNISAGFQPKDGTVTNGNTWKTVDNIFKATARVDELFNDQAYSGFGRVQASGNRYGYMCTYVWSPVIQNVTMKHGHADQAVFWLNGVNRGTFDSGRYLTYSLQDAPGVLPQQFSTAITLQAGWNTLLFKTQARSSSQRGWMLNVQIEGNTQAIRFSTRGLKLQATLLGAGQVKLDCDSLANDLFKHADSYRFWHGPSPENITASTAASADTTHTFTVGSGNRWFGVAAENEDYDSVSERMDAVLINVVDGATDEVPPSQDPPAPLAVEDMPMLVSLGFDDNWKPGAIDKLINDVFTPDLLNHNGSRVLASWYMIGENLDNTTLNGQIIRLNNDGHEIGNHGWWGLASGGPRGSVANWEAWIEPTQQGLIDLGITPPVGFRAAQDEYDEFMHTVLAANGLDYSCSAQTCHSSNGNAENGYYPGTLEAGWPGNATFNTRELGNHPGQWEIPQTYPDGLGQYCDTDFQDDCYSALNYFNEYRSHIARAMSPSGNRAPVSICLHGQRYGPTNIGGADTGVEGCGSDAWPVWRAEMRAFILDMLATYPEVKFVRHRDVMDFMTDPVALGNNPVTVNPTPSTVSIASPSPIVATSPTVAIAPNASPIVIVSPSPLVIPELAPEEPQEPDFPPPRLSVTRLACIFPAFNQQQADLLIDGALSSYVRPWDTIFLISGNNANALNLDFIQNNANDIVTAHPTVKVYAMMAGLTNIQAILADAPTNITGLVYNYEQNMPNEPEYSHDFEITKTNVGNFAALVAPTSYEAVLNPSGLLLDDTNFVLQFGWDYAELGSMVDWMNVQTQRFAGFGLSKWRRAIGKLDLQHRMLGASANPYTVQVTVDTGSTNGTFLHRSVEASRYAMSVCKTGQCIWFSPNVPEQLSNFLDRMPR